MEAIKDEIIFLSEKDESTEEIIIKINKVTMSKDINEFIDSTVTVLRTVGKKSYKEYPMSLKIAVAISSCFVNHGIVNIYEDTTVFEFFNKLETVYISPISINIRSMVRDGSTWNA